LSSSPDRQLELIDGDAFLETPNDVDPVAVARPTTWWRRWRGRLLVIALCLGLVGLGVFTYMTYQTGLEWQASAQDLSAQLTATESKLSNTRTRLVETKSDLKTTQAKLEDRSSKLRSTRGELAGAREDITELEGKLRTVANEKAQVEDEREQAQASAEYLAGVAGQAAVVGADLDTCVVDLQNWIGRWPSFYDEMWVWDGWIADGEAISSACGDARIAFWDFYAALPE
jgi:uncharacterized protein HemX